MPHGFVRDMLEVDTRNFRLMLGACLIGGLLLGVSYLSNLLFQYTELTALVSLSAACSKHTRGLGRYSI